MGDAHVRQPGLADIDVPRQLLVTVKQVFGLQRVLLQAVCVQATGMVQSMPICLVEQMQLLLLAIGGDR